MVYFIEERIPPCVKYEMAYEEDYAVDIVETGGSDDVRASEYRRLNHPFPRRRFMISYQVERDELYLQIHSLFHRAFGKFAGFRFRHMDDFTTANNGTDAPTAFDQALKRIDATHYQMRKQYGHEKTPLALSWPERLLYKPVAGTVLLAINGAASTAFSVDNTTGIITLNAAAATTDNITGGCQFDYPVRFNSPIKPAANHATSRAVDFELIELLNL